MITPHFLSTEDHQFTAQDRVAVTAACESADLEVRDLLPGLRESLHLLVWPSRDVIPETGEVGFAMSPDVVQWKVDPMRDVSTVAQTHLRHALFHELHHCVRLQRVPSYYMPDWYDGAVFEGLATVFQREAGWSPPWGDYPDDVAEWAEELFAQPVDHTFSHWRFNHPDGRRWICYRVGTWVAERAVERSGRSAADLVWESAQAVVELAGLRYAPVS